jgi:O-antigen/teichoic acid export membrane protein
MILANILLSGIGFIFWVLAARVYSAMDIGLATAVISASNLLGAFSALGLTVGIIRFLPDEKDKPAMINSCFTVVGLFSVILSVCFISGLSIWSPALLFLRENIIFSIIFVLLTTTYIIFWLQYHIFVALRSAEFTLAQSLIAGSRIFGLIFMIGLGSLGVVSSFALGFIVAVLAAFFFIRKLIPGYSTAIKVHKSIVSSMVSFSLGNYIGDTLKMLPGLIIPVILVNIINPETSAYFFIALMIANILFMVSYSTGYSLLAENSLKSEGRRRQVIKALILNLVILIPAVLIVWFFGKDILSIFGKGYSSEAFPILWLLALTSIPSAMNETYVTVFRIEMKVKPIILMRAFAAISTMVAGYLLIGIMGLAGIGIAWLASEIIVMLCITPLMFNKLMRSSALQGSI